METTSAIQDITSSLATKASSLGIAVSQSAAMAGRKANEVKETIQEKSDEILADTEQTVSEAYDKTSRAISDNYQCTLEFGRNNPGLGALPHNQGCSFRIWAPHAEAVYVTGTFNHWAERKTPMAHEGEGYWSVDVRDAKIGDEYRYILVNGEQILSRIDPWARQVTNSVGNAVIHDAAFDWGNDAEFPIPSLNELVIYEMHIGTFARESTDAPGTFTNAIQKLPYLKSLGINAIELLPIAEFAGGISWGYNPAHPFAVESEYGGPKEFKEFVKAAHAHGIAVILDVVYNHLGPSDLDLWQFDGWHENNQGGIFFYNDARSKTPWGDTRPDYGRAEVRQYLRDNAMMWIDEYHIDGLRFDSVVNIRNAEGNNDDPENDLPEGWSLLQWITSEVKARKPMAFTIAEDLQANEFLTKNIAEAGAGFDTQWEPRFLCAVRDAIAAFDDEHRNLARIQESLLFNFNGDVFQRVIYTESHDDVAEGDVRIPEKISPGDAGNWFAKKRSTLGTVLTLTAPGIPMIFQGQEFLENQGFDDQQPLDWSKAESYGGIMKLHADLLHLRLNRGGVSKGLIGQGIEITHFDDANKVFAFHRWAESGAKDSVLVVINFSQQQLENYALPVPQAGLWQVRFNSDSDAYDQEFGNHGIAAITATVMEDEPLQSIIHLAPYSALILSQD